MLPYSTNSAFNNIYDRLASSYWVRIVCGVWHPQKMTPSAVLSIFYKYKRSRLCATRQLLSKLQEKRLHTRRMSYDITLETPVADYKKLMDEKMLTDEFVEDYLREEYFIGISKAVLETVWKLLFSEENAPPEKLAKAAELLKVYKPDACYHGPDQYNEWIPKLRDELLRRNMVDFWRDEIVKHALGPCWAMDSDLFDDLEDPEPANFYKYAGCVAPFAMEVVEDLPKANGEGNNTPSNVLISLENPVADYQKFVKEKLCSDEFADDVELEESFLKISKAARETVWKLLFDDEEPTAEDLAKAAELLCQHKKDACFYNPNEYNQWIPTLRDELLKRHMYGFWREHMVKKELGPCWARDSDFFDDMEDPEPLNFYKYANCVAPFAPAQNSAASDIPAAPNTSTVFSLCPSSPAGLHESPVGAPSKIGFKTPAADYTAKLQHQNDDDPDDTDKLNEIFAEARQVIWDLLFKETPLSSDNFQKAAALLEAYKSDACFYNPHEYNDWVPTLRDELFKRKYFDFWKQIIVDKECGLCWYKDSDYFDDAGDTRPIEFLKSGDALMANEEAKNNS